jgi:RNA polymerase primary sigma factor
MQREETTMNLMDPDLQQLISLAKSQGCLTYAQVNQYLPDEAVSPEKLDNLLVALDELGVDLVDKAPEGVANTPVDPSLEAREDVGEELSPLESLAKLTDDPIRMYLTQMARIGLLSREQEISLAKRIEVTRKRFRRTLLSCNFAHAQTVE